MYALLIGLLTATFQPVTERVDGTPIPATTPVVYELWQGLRGQTRVRIGAISSGHILPALPPGEYCWHLTATVDGATSEPGNVVCRVIAAAAPRSVTIVIK